MNSAEAHKIGTYTCAGPKRTNGADAKSAQMFTLAHELAHIWLGSEGVSGFEGLSPHGTDVEDWCNRAAAEFLAPAQEVRARRAKAKRQGKPFEALARPFKGEPRGRRPPCSRPASR